MGFWLRARPDAAKGEPRGCKPNERTRRAPRPSGTFLESGASRLTRIERLRKKGIRRLGSPQKGFRYQTAEGRAPGAKDLARIRSLVLPPAWKDVGIAASPTAALQAGSAKAPAPPARPEAAGRRAAEARGRRSCHDLAVGWTRRNRRFFYGSIRKPGSAEAPPPECANT
jgi:hypothetical protein